MHEYLQGHPVRERADGMERFGSYLKRLATPLEKNTRNYPARDGRYERSIISDDKRNSASVILSLAIKHDDQLMRLVGAHMQSPDMDPINLLRENHELRCETLLHFMDILEDIRSEDPERLPPRVRYDDPDNLKEPNYVANAYPVKKMTSSAYAAMLALSMIDGSFDWERAKRDTTPSYIRADGTDGGGSHRDAALVILGVDLENVPHDRSHNYVGTAGYPDMDRKNDMIISQLQHIKDLPTENMTVLEDNGVTFVAVSTASRRGLPVIVFQSLEGVTMVVPTTEENVLRLHGDL